jgi:hypothetical protein
MKIPITLSILGFAMILGAATLINPLQLKPPATGTFVLTAVNGVISWIAPTTNVVLSFADQETPGGTINGTNPTFTLAHSDTATGTSLMLIRNGVLQTGAGVDFTLSGTTITFVTASIPQTGDTLVAWYRY